MAINGRKSKHALPPVVTGEIRFDDGYSILVPVADLSKPHPSDAYIHTLPGLPVHAEVMQYAQHTAANGPSVAAKPQTEPLWARLCLWAGAALLIPVGLALIALGLLR